MTDDVLTLVPTMFASFGVVMVLITSQVTSHARSSDELPRVPERASLAIQAEKLRMAVLEARDIGRVQQRVLGVGLAVAGASLLIPGAFELLEPNRTTQLTELGIIDVSAGALLVLSGASVIVGSGAATGIAPENGLWVRLQRLEELRKKDPELHLAEAETAFESAVQRATFVRKVTGVGLMALGIGLGTAKALVLGLSGASRIEQGLAQIQPTLLLGLGLLTFIGYRAPLEAAWATYLDDKNMDHPYVTWTPALSLTPHGGVIAGLGGAF